MLPKTKDHQQTSFYTTFEEQLDHSTFVVHSGKQNKLATV